MAVVRSMRYVRVCWGVLAWQVYTFILCILARLKAVCVHNKS